MKKTMKFLRIIALIAVIGFSMAGCGGGGGGGTIGALNGVWVTGSGADQEELTINNDSWEVKIGNIKSMRGVYTTMARKITDITFETTEVHGDYLEDKNPGEDFGSKWYSKDDLKQLNPKNTDKVLDPYFPTFEGEYDGTTLTIGGDDYTKKGGGGGNGGGGNGIAPTTSGSLTITGLSQYNGKYIGGTSVQEVNGYMLLAYDGFSGTTDNGVIHLKQISNGTAVLKVWQGNDKGVYSFSGSASAVPFMLYILNSPTVEGNQEYQNIDYTDFSDMSMQTVNFSGGRGTIKWEGMMGGMWD